MISLLQNIPLRNILFLDIETVPAEKSFQDLNEKMQKLWSKKADNLQKNGNDQPLTAEEIYQRAGIYAEFGKIICISTGFFGQDSFRVKSFYGDNEAELLQNFADLLNKYFYQPFHILCAHNGKEFDFPYISRRMIINRIPLPAILDTAGKKPWEVNHLDTMELWKFGDYKSYTSLELLSAIFNIPTPKDDIDGSQVADVYYNQNDLERIAVYCQKDTVTVARLLLKYRGNQLIKDEDIVYV